jgi:hypothetical protein
MTDPLPGGPGFDLGVYCPREVGFTMPKVSPLPLKITFICTNAKHEKEARVGRYTILPHSRCIQMFIYGVGRETLQCRLTNTKEVHHCEETSSFYYVLFLQSTRLYAGDDTSQHAWLYLVEMWNKMYQQELL